MKNSTIRTLRFSISHWQQLYSLHEAIEQAHRLQGKHLDVSGTLRNEDVLSNQDTDITLHFYQVSDTPDYQRDNNGIILGTLIRNTHGLTSELPVNAQVFEEMRKNLVEYADIDGIHIRVNIGIQFNGDQLEFDTPLNIVSLEYAMRGDA